MNPSYQEIKKQSQPKVSVHYLACNILWHIIYFLCSTRWRYKHDKGSNILDLQSDTKLHDILSQSHWRNYILLFATKISDHFPMSYRALWTRIHLNKCWKDNMRKTKQQHKIQFLKQAWQPESSNPQFACYRLYVPNTEKKIYLYNELCCQRSISAEKIRRNPDFQHYIIQWHRKFLPHFHQNEEFFFS